MYECMYVYGVYVCVRTCVCINAHTYACVCICMYLFTCVYLALCSCLSLQAYIDMYIYICVCVSVYPFIHPMSVYMSIHLPAPKPYTPPHLPNPPLCVLCGSLQSYMNEYIWLGLMLIFKKIPTNAQYNNLTFLQLNHRCIKFNELIF